MATQPCSAGHFQTESDQAQVTASGDFSVKAAKPIARLELTFPLSSINGSKPWFFEPSDELFEQLRQQAAELKAEMCPKNDRAPSDCCVTSQQATLI
ncbi:hypothetical protein GPECTOR_4g653 [Gonium pectorale]|uniref:Uncharacterized protein n=1 Tax=Gonium pectorale TaxID=33097 RepID=A0A150GY28_GONPE|nr:hypothetical protein GPECTOR_4g653 [Gonium pectorale]|eukprot:KXZ54588.1 hypothetical protein GPECTOR_4g653 [Gonium pectorale]